MIEKLNIGQIVRYLFSSMLFAFGILLTSGFTTIEIADWIAKNPWVKEPAPATALLAILLLIGYVLFNLYLSLIYEIVIVWLKGQFAKLFKVYTYREFICDVLKEQGVYNVGPIQAERVYAVIKMSRLFNFYERAGASITTSFHFFYYADILMFVCTVFRFRELLFLNLLSIVGFFLVIVMDWHFESLELMLFRIHKDDLVQTISKLKENGAWQNEQTQTETKS